MAKFKCKNPSCSKFDISVEGSIDELTGAIIMDAGRIKICPYCGEERVYDEDGNRSTPSFNIDEIALGTKRMYETKVRKYN